MRARPLANVALATTALLAPSTGEARPQRRSEREDRAPRRDGRGERRAPANRGERANVAERAARADQRGLVRPAGTTCRMACMWAGGRREYENVRSATVTYGPGGSSASEVSVRTDEGQPLGMVFGTGVTCIGESMGVATDP